jgi:deazaflavin-dependent oxidoreductase (nitroreductase family)
MPRRSQCQGSGNGEAAGRARGSRAPRQAQQYLPGHSRHMENTIMSALVRGGLIPSSYLLTTLGRKTGRPRTNPVIPVEHGGRWWLVAPYGPVSWVQNARATGQISLTRRRDTRDYTIREIPPQRAGPILKRYIRIAPATRPHFQANKNSPVKDFVAEADRHPVFKLMLAREDHQRGHRKG